MMNAAVILNPTAGQGKPIAVQEHIEKLFRQQGLSCHVTMTEKSGDATRLAREAVGQGFGLVVAVGGDGTINEVVNGIAGTGIKLGIIPMGTVNVLARELRIPFNTKRAVKLIAAGKTRQIDLGCANGRHFTLMVGCGFDAEVVANILQPMKDVIGSGAYVIKGLEMLAKYEATDITLEMPNEIYTSKAFLVIVANSPTYTYRLRIAPYATPDDGLLDIIVFERPNTDRIGFIRQIAEVFIRRHTYHRAVKYFRAESVVIRSNPAVMVQVDGDPICSTPVEINIARHSLPIFVP